MPFFVASRRMSPQNIYKRFGDVLIHDVTSHGPDPWIRFSPFYPHGNIPVPFAPEHTAMSVEGIWQGLKVFETTDVDPAKLAITTMKHIKRSARRFGAVLGHRAGLDGDRLLAYEEARRMIYLPSYRWVLEHCLQQELNALLRLGELQTVVLLDYETNGDISNLSRPLSHATLIVAYLNGTWPQ
ncbi:MAG: hypothetical protein GFH27_549307n88 [Chloroflexi bacterium AL-W]|nr:hypothetical protein [Chloroflexi bacterium AL-N1]NOK69120.1 hypothetical protein [Chloroflexi bacterium AL-N10]NOK77103.1 hypothetical protein [Chloroflexi bacterium AL-N5]NOK83748.1 hypothetical protein [Chloroflexi bacterium AL-W]NOK90958.1 hypothetical protein [Chloroflexi bacterium AL-N15]